MRSTIEKGSAHGAAGIEPCAADPTLTDPAPRPEESAPPAETALDDRGLFSESPEARRAVASAPHRAAAP